MPQQDLEEDLLDAVDWMLQRGAHTARFERERIMLYIEHVALALRRSGAASRWLAGADPLVAKVAGDCHGPLMHFLAEACGYHDRRAIELLRSGGPLVCCVVLLPPAYVFVHVSIAGW